MSKPLAYHNTKKIDRTLQKKTGGEFKRRLEKYILEQSKVLCLLVILQMISLGTYARTNLVLFNEQAIIPLIT